MAGQRDFSPSASEAGSFASKAAQPRFVAVHDPQQELVAVLLALVQAHAQTLRRAPVGGELDFDFVGGGTGHEGLRDGFGR